MAVANGQGHSPESGQATKVQRRRTVQCSVQYAFWYRSRLNTRCEASHRLAAHIAKTQSRLDSINRFVAGCEIDKMTSAEIAFAIFIAKHTLPMAVGDEFGLLAKKMWCTTVPVAPLGGGKNTNYRFSRFFVRAVPLFRSLMLTPMIFAHSYCANIILG